MEIGNDDLDFIDDDLDVKTGEDVDQLDSDILEDSNVEYSTEETYETSEQEDDLVASLLKARGIEDKSKIKFENDEGEIEEVNWDTLDTQTRLNILNSSTRNENINLDDSEMQLINTIRQSQLNPSEYIQYIQKKGIDDYLQNNANNTISYKVDDLSDEELFVSDLIARIGITEEEAYEALDRAKANEALFNKQIKAIRTEYKSSEEEAIRYNEFKEQQKAQEQYNRFAQNVQDQISDFTEFAGCDLNMNNEDMQELYDFITGFDPAGNSYFGKALNDPPTLVRMAWFALNGEKMIQDINEYYKKEIANVRKESYNKGLQKIKDKPSVVYKNKTQNLSTKPSFDDLDDF